MKHSRILLFLLAGFFALFVQDVRAQDYVITNRGDSLTGEVKPQLYGPEKRVQITLQDNEKTTLSLFDIRVFSYDGALFRPVKGENGYVFMKLLQPGYLSLYAYQAENQTRYDGLLLKKADGDQLVVPNLGFRKNITRFLADCPEISSKVEEGVLGRNDLTAIIDQYNACVAHRTATRQEAVVEKSEVSARINPWNALEEKVRAKDFAGKTDALDMITEIKKKIQRQEKIPNFLIDGLKNSLQGAGLTQQLDEAILNLSRE